MWLKLNSLTQILLFTTLTFLSASCSAGLKATKTKVAENARSGKDTQSPPTTEQPAAKLQSPDCIDPDLNKLASDQSLMLCDGTIAQGKLKSTTVCGKDGDSNCVLGGSFVAIDSTKLLPQNIKAGEIIAGITGTLNAASTVDPWDLRAGVSSGGVTGKLKVACRNPANLSQFDIDLPRAVTVNDTTDLITMVTGNHNFTDGDDVRINFNNTAPTPLSHMTTYKVIVNDASSFQLGDVATPAVPIDITAAGIDVTVVNYGTDGNIDVWDNIDVADTYNTPWTSENVCKGQEAAAEDENIWRDVTTGGCAANPTECRIQDKVSLLQWSKKAAADYDWANAILYCQNLTQDGAAAGTWRLPTAIELQQAYHHGIYTAADPNWVSATDLEESYWSSTSISEASFDFYAWYVSPANGFTYNLHKRSTSSVICVRN